MKIKELGVYIIRSTKNGRFYIGSTNNFEARISQHNKGFVAATKNLRPLELKRFIPCANLTKTKQAEYRLKKYKRRDILEKVIQDGVFPWDYSSGV